MDSFLHCCAAVHVLLSTQLSIVRERERVRLFARVPAQNKRRGQTNNTSKEKKNGPENLPLKAVIALMAAAVAFMLSRPAKDLRTGSSPLRSLYNPKPWGEGRSTLADGGRSRKPSPGFGSCAVFRWLHECIPSLSRAAIGSSPQLFPFKCAARCAPDFI